jgi:hypothetical protein
MFFLAILAAAGKRNKKRRNIAKLHVASLVEMMLPSHASMGGNNSKSGGSTAKGNKRISALGHLKETMSLQSYYMICLRAPPLSRQLRC